MSGKQKKKTRGMSGTAKWIITMFCFAIAICTVLLCIKSGNFSFKPGYVQANDNDVQETAAPKETESSDETVTKFNVFVSAGKGGTVSPEGIVSVEDWGSVTVNCRPNEGYALQSVSVDGENKGAVSSYTLSYIREDHVIIVKFKPIPKPTETPEIDDPIATEYFNFD